MMNAKKLANAKREALRFLARVRACEAENYQFVIANGDSRRFPRSRASASVKRASLDLSRALVELRK